MTARASGVSRTCSFRNPSKRWRPKKWHGNYELMVALSCMGRSNKEIATQFRYTPEHVSAILNTPEALVVRRQLLEHLKEKITTSIPTRLELIADKATQRLYDLLHDDEKFVSHPFAVVDRGMKVLTGLSHLRSEGESGKVNIDKALILAPEIAQRMVQALELSRKARELNPWPKEDASSS